MTLQLFYKSTNYNARGILEKREILSFTTEVFNTNINIIIVKTISSDAIGGKSLEEVTVTNVPDLKRPIICHGRPSPLGRRLFSCLLIYVVGSHSTDITKSFSKVAFSPSVFSRSCPTLGEWETLVVIVASRAGGLLLSTEDAQFTPVTCSSRSVFRSIVTKCLMRR